LPHPHSNFPHAAPPTARSTLSLHDALPISRTGLPFFVISTENEFGTAALLGLKRKRRSYAPFLTTASAGPGPMWALAVPKLASRSEEHTLNSSHVKISYAVFCLKKKKRDNW